MRTINDHHIIKRNQIYCQRGLNPRDSLLCIVNFSSIGSNGNSTKLSLSLNSVRISLNLKRKKKKEENFIKSL